MQEWDPPAPVHHQVQAYLWLLVSRTDAKLYFNLTDAYMNGLPSPAADDNGGADESVHAGADEALNAGTNSHEALEAGADSPGGVLHASTAPPTTRASGRLLRPAHQQSAEYREAMQHFANARATAGPRTERIGQGGGGPVEPATVAKEAREERLQGLRGIAV